MKQVWGLLGAAFSGRLLMADQQTVVIPAGVMSAAALNTAFLAKTALCFAVILLGTMLAGIILQRLFRLPTIAGQIIGGIILGPSVINIASHSLFNGPCHIAGQALTYQFISSDLILFFIGMISSLITVPCLLWMAGHETDVDQLKQVGLVAVLAGVLGALVPIIFTLLALMPTGAGMVQLIAMGLIFSATSVSIPVAMLISYKKMQTRSARATLGAAVVDDIVAVLLLSVFFIVCPAHTAMHHQTSLFSALGFMAFGSLVMMALGMVVMPRIVAWFKRADLGLLAPLAQVAMLSFFALSEMLAGLAGITGAYFAGLFFRKNDLQHRAYEVIAPFVQGLLLPLFLGSIGLSLNLGILALHDWLLVLLLTGVAILSKLAACFITTFIANRLAANADERWSSLETYIFGSSMVARGEVGLVVASLLAGAGIISAQWYNVAVVVIVLTTIATPLLLALGFDREKRKAQYEYVLSLGGIMQDDDIDFVFNRLASYGLKAQLHKANGVTRIMVIDPQIAIEIQKDRASILGDDAAVKNLLPVLDKTVQEIQNNRVS